MPTPHPRPWRRDSVFGAGPRRPLDREQRARFRFLLVAHGRIGRVTAKGERVGEALVKRLSVDGRCDPSHQTLALDARCSARSVRRALDSLRTLGLVVWQRRLVREGWRTAQTSNAYVLVPSVVAIPAAVARKSCGGHFGRQTLQESLIPVAEVSEAERNLARAALARVRERRLAALHAGRLTREVARQA